MKNAVGIIAYGIYIPQYRIKTEKIATVWEDDPEVIIQNLGIVSKSVPGLDEDSATFAVNAAIQTKRRALIYLQRKSIEIGSVYVGSESPPYAVKPTAALVGEALDLENNWTAADLQFACKAGTAALQIVLSGIQAKSYSYGISIGTDIAQSKPRDTLEYSAGAGAACFLLGSNKIIAEIKSTLSVTSDTPDFWRRAGETFPSHSGRFTSEPAYLKHIITTIDALLRNSGLKISEFDHYVFHAPNIKFPLILARHFGLPSNKIRGLNIVSQIGNTYSANSLIALASTLDIAKPFEKILMCSYGSGAGSDSFIIIVTPEILKYRRVLKEIPTDVTSSQQLKKNTYLNYSQYLRHMRIIG